MKFSIIVVSLNAGEKLIDTVKNILAQKDVDLEIVLKDGLSKDGSVDAVKTLNDNRVRIFEQKDSGIYDGMNQGISNATGDYFIFMNCGDFFYDEMVLARFAKAAEEYITSNGIKGSFQTSLSSAHEEVAPGMNKEAKGVGALGTAIAQAAKNTEATDAALASSIKVQTV